METKTQRFGTLDEFMSLSDEWDKTHEYGVAWVDGTATATALGRGIYIAANHADNGPLQPHNNEAMSVPFTPPIGVINPLTTRAFNAVNWNLHSKRSTNRRQAYDPYFYPLDRLNHWNRLYGKRGFQQFQCVIPEANAQAGLKELLRVISNSGQASFLTVLKRCGDIPSPGLMSFPMPGISLAIDFPMSPTLIRATLPTLDKIVREAKGRLYPAKDAHMSGEDFRNAYPAWQQVEALRDPALMSQFWARVIS